MTDTVKQVITFDRHGPQAGAIVDALIAQYPADTDEAAFAALGTIVGVTVSTALITKVSCEQLLEIVAHFYDHLKSELEAELAALEVDE